MSISHLVHYIRPAFKRDQFKLCQHAHGDVIPVLEAHARILSDETLMRFWASKGSALGRLTEKQITISILQIDFFRPVVFIDSVDFNTTHPEQTFEELDTNRTKNYEREAEKQ